jgi:hypothetical protein
MLTISEAQRRTELFLTGQMLEALRAVEYGLPALIPSCTDVDLAEVARARVEIRHVRGASDATYLINAFGEELLMQLQLNAHRLVVVYRARTRCARRQYPCGTSLPVSPAIPNGGCRIHGGCSPGAPRGTRRQPISIACACHATVAAKDYIFTAYPSIRRGEGGHYRRPSSRLRSSH